MLHLYLKKCSHNVANLYPPFQGISKYYCLFGAMFISNVVIQMRITFKNQSNWNYFFKPSCLEVLTSRCQEYLYGCVLKKVSPAENGSDLVEVPFSMKMVAILQYLKQKTNIN